MNHLLAVVLDHYFQMLVEALEKLEDDLPPELATTVEVEALTITGIPKTGGPITHRVFPDLQGLHRIAYRLQNDRDILLSCEEPCHQPTEVTH